LELFGENTMYLIFIFTLLSLVGSFLSFLYHRKITPTLISVVGVGFIFYSYYLQDEVDNILYIGFTGLLISGILNYYQNKIFKMKSPKRIELFSTITCRYCRHKKKEEMPTDSCMYFYECEHCKERLKPKRGDCCVYCSYGDVKCPPVQTGDKSCC